MKRFRQIVTVLAKYGFSDIVERLNLSPFLKAGRKILRVQEPISATTTAARIRSALEDLGPTFVKFGQVLSTRSFLIPASWLAELTQLQDKVKSVPFETLRPIVEAELGDQLSAHYSSFDEVPVASASVAQVHRAVTTEGDQVVVKIQRPEIDELVQTDMEILLELASLVEKYLPESRRFNPKEMVDELARSTKRELDFMNEARNIELFAHNFADDERVHVPTVFWEHSSSKILTIEYIAGCKINAIEKLKEMNIDPEELAQYGAQFILKQIFEDGYFHADPHPGNLLVCEGGVIAPIDFGIMGRLDDELVEVFSDLLIAASRRDIALIIRVMSDLGIVDDSSDTRLLQRDISDFFNRYYGVSLRKMHMKTIFDEALEMMNRHHLSVPPNFLLLAKTLGAYEDIGEQLYVDFDFSKEVKPYLLKLLKRRLDPERIAYQGIKTMRDFYKLLSILPYETESMLRRVKGGKVSFQLEHRGLDNLIKELDRSSNRLSFSLIIAALIVASSMLLRWEIGPSLLGYSVFGLFGYLFAGLLGVWLTIGILRSGRL